MDWDCWLHSEEESCSWAPWDWCRFPLQGRGRPSRWSCCGMLDGTPRVVGSLIFRCSVRPKLSCYRVTHLLALVASNPKDDSMLRFPRGIPRIPIGSLELHNKGASQLQKTFNWMSDFSEMQNSVPEPQTMLTSRPWSNKNLMTFSFPPAAAQWSGVSNPELKNFFTSIPASFTFAVRASKTIMYPFLEACWIIVYMDVLNSSLSACWIAKSPPAPYLNNTYGVLKCYFLGKQIPQRCQGAPFLQQSVTEWVHILLFVT